jgi:hypothetical protein
LSIPKAIKTKSGNSINPREAFRCSLGSSFLSADFKTVPKLNNKKKNFIKLEIRVAALLRKNRYNYIDTIWKTLKT